MRWKKRPEGSNWGDFGADDQLGTLNYLTSEAVRSAVAEVRVGKTFCLSLPLDVPGGNVLNERRHPPMLEPTEKQGMLYTNFPIGKFYPGAMDVLSDDKVTMYLQYSTQWDGLAHAGALFDADADGHAERVYYNGFRPNIDILGLMDFEESGCFKERRTGLTSSHAKALDVSVIAAQGVQGRGVVIDLFHHFGDDFRLVGYDDLMAVIEKDQIEIRQGDIVLLRTNFAQRLLEMNKNPDPHLAHHMCAVLDGNDERIHAWVTESKIAAIAADNYAVEEHPAKIGPNCCHILPLHHHCMFKLGLPLGELWYLTELADWLRAHHRHSFLLTAPPLRLPGAVGSPVTPIATV